MATRRRDSQALNEYSWVLHSGDQATQGEQAGLDTATGDVRPMGSSSTQIFIGFFAETLLGDGTKKVRVSLPDEVNAEWLDNDDSPNDVGAADIGSEVYAKDGHTVSTLSTSRSKAGRVLDYDSDSNLVLVQGGTAVTGPTGAAGVAGTVASRTALAAVAAGSRSDGQVVEVLDDGSIWHFVAASSLTMDGPAAATSNLVIQPDAGTGRWIRNCGTFMARFAISKDTLDAAQLCVIPTGYGVRLAGMPMWDVVTGFTGGTNSAIGLSASAIATTKGDLLGGAGGQLTAVLGTAGLKGGTIGPLIDTLAELQAFFLKAGDYFRFDRIVDAYTAGAGFIDVPITFFPVG